MDQIDQEANNNSSSDGNTSFFKTLFNGLNAIIGVGLLSMPYALASGGWLSLILLLAISGAAGYAGLLTKRCMDANPKIKTYAEIGEAAFGKLGKTIVSIVLYVDLYLVLTGYLILEGDNLHNLFPEMNIHMKGISIGGKQSFVIIIAVALLPTVWLDNLSILAYISATGVVSALLILGSILSVGIFDGVGFHNKGELLNWKGIPMAMSLYMFSYSANPVFPTLYSSMKKKHHFSKVLIIGFACATICYTSMAILGYLMFGSALQSQITLNLPTHTLSSKIAIYTAWISPLSKYALMMEPVAATTESWFPKYQKNKGFKILLRTILVATQVVVAVTIPFFGSLMSLVGALLSATASITIPCLCYLKISKNSGRSIEHMFIMLLILLSLVIVALGTYTSLRSIIKEAIKHHRH
ncbi:amino acid transporter AVT1I-like [Chenopodium quinoa]|uniref:Amino acid transporter transmembrane domain-containing protein n=1 Tax=Chenopodium quinoa TaxID=63459 RepID=A0A803LFE3_CHEQI|nr:amino acid transporter AVT1I-like [Chenopodium quinoa]